MPPKKKKKPAKKAAKKSAEKSAKALEVKRKRAASDRRKLIDHYAGSASSIDAIETSVRRVTGKGLSPAEKSEASSRLVAKIIRGKRR